MEVTRSSINVGVGLGTTMHSTARQTLFLLIAKHKFYLRSLSNNWPFQQSKFESKVLQSYKGNKKFEVLIKHPAQHFLVINFNLILWLKELKIMYRIIKSRYRSSADMRISADTDYISAYRCNSTLYTA